MASWLFAVQFSLASITNDRASGDCKTLLVPVFWNTVHLDARKVRIVERRKKRSPLKRNFSFIRGRIAGPSHGDCGCISRQAVSNEHIRCVHEDFGNNGKHGMSLRVIMQLSDPSGNDS
uniref:Uncharacterized protein n=1 Tax=Coccidioides posadasii RMSCC 3488 TaxID=454284 RepID=A0A0J6FKI8_COCPO|nr:hypothetical protein CPAG_06257 [Coccidioides posadasii RMSCC 3488]